MPLQMVKGKLGSAWAAALPDTPDLFKIDWASGFDLYGYLSIEPLGAGDKPDGVLTVKPAAGPRRGVVSFELVHYVTDEAVNPGDSLGAKAGGGGRVIKSAAAAAIARALDKGSKSGTIRAARV